MLARLQRFIVYALLTLSTSLALGLTLLGHPVMATASALGVWGAHALVLAAECVCVACVEAPEHRPPLTDLLRAWVSEALTSPRIFYWRQPFRSRAELDLVPASTEQRRGVVLVHGLVCNRGFWTPWMRRLRRRAVPFIAVDLEPPFAAIEAFSRTIDDAVRRLRAATGFAPVVIAHSMGGLAVRHWLCSLPSGTPTLVHHVVTIGTPHRGTWMARFARSGGGPQMAIGSAWLAGLERAEQARCGELPPFTCFYGDCDNIVFPAANARLVGADNRRIPRTAHVALAFREEVFAEALHRLGLATPGRQ